MGNLITFITNAIISHAGAEGAGALYFFYVAVACMPKPGQPWTKATMYDWMYQTLHTALPINRFLPSQPTITAAPVVAPVEPQVSVPEPVGKPLSATIAQFGRK